MDADVRHPKEAKALASERGGGGSASGLSFLDKFGRHHASASAAKRIRRPSESRRPAHCRASAWLLRASACWPCWGGIASRLNPHSGEVCVPRGRGRCCIRRRQGLFRPAIPTGHPVRPPPPRPCLASRLSGRVPAAVPLPAYRAALLGPVSPSLPATGLPPSSSGRVYSIGLVQPRDRRRQTETASIPLDAGPHAAPSAGLGLPPARMGWKALRGRETRRRRGRRTRGLPITRCALFHRYSTARLLQSLANAQLDKFCGP